MPINNLQLKNLYQKYYHTELLFKFKSSIQDRNEMFFYVPPARKLVFLLHLTVAQCSILRYRGMQCKN